MRTFMKPLALIALMAAPAAAQQSAGDPAMSMAPAGSMTANEVGAAPMMGTSPANYAAWAADSDMYEIQSSKLALSKSRNDGVKQFAREMIADHMQTTKSLMAALPRTEPRVPKPAMKLSADNAAMIAQLRGASAAQFDQMYLSQQMMAHQKAWSLHKGFSQDGADPALRQVATSAVPIIEKHIQHLKAMPGGGMSGM